MRPRSRLTYTLITVTIMVVGAASRKFPALLPAALGKYPGDSFWALMVFSGWGVILTKFPSIRLGAIALLTACAVEFSQLYQAPWINAIRASTAGHLVLGSRFSWPDILAYTVGIVFGVIGEIFFRKLTLPPAARPS